MNDDKQPSSKKLILVYILTTISNCSFQGLLGSYAMVKKPFSQELGLEEGFLGITEGINYFVRALGLIVILIFPSFFPKKDYFLHSILISSSLSLIPLSTYFQQYAQIAIIIAFVISGYSRCYNFVPFLIANQYFDAEGKDKNKMKMWIAVGGLGDVVAVVGTTVLINYCGWDWKTTFYLSLGISFVSSLLVYIFTEEVDMQTQQRAAMVQGGWQSIQRVKQFLGKKGNLLWALDSGILTAGYFTMMSWFPYYYISLGYKIEVAYMSSSIPLALPLGVALYTVIQRLTNFQQKYLNYILLFIAGIILFCMIFVNSTQKNQQSIIEFTIGSSIVGMLMAGPWSFISSTQLKKRSRNNQQLYIGMVTTRFSFQALTFLFLVVTGYLMERKLQLLIYFLSAVLFVDLLLNFLRRTYIEQDNLFDHQPLNEDLQNIQN